MAASVLQKISAEARKIKRKHPHKYDKLKNSWAKGYIPEAARRVKAGRKTKRKKVGAVKKATRKRAAPKRVARKRLPRKKNKGLQVVRVVQTKTAERRVGRRRVSKRRVGNNGGGNGGGGGRSNTGLMLGIGIAALGVILLTRRQQPTYPAGYQNLPPVQQTGNLTRDTQARNIIQYAMAAGLAITAISNLIDRLNRSDDQQVSNIYNDVNTTGDLGNWV